MSVFQKALLSLVVMLVLVSGTGIGGDIYQTAQRLWQPVTDEVYLQEVAQKIETDAPVVSVAEFDGTCYAVIKGQIYQLKADAFELAKSAPVDVNRLIAADGCLWAMAADGLHRFNGKKWQRLDDRQYIDLCMHRGVLHGATREDVFRLEKDHFSSIQPEGGYLSSDKTMIMEDGTQILADPVRIGPILRIASYSGTLYVLRPGSLALVDRKVVAENFIDWGGFPSPNTFDMLALGSRLFITTDRGLAIVRGASMFALTGADGLPSRETTCLAKGFANDVWIGTTTGAVRMLKDDWHYFGAYHWLPGNNVHDIAVGDKIVYIATDGGVGIIRYEPFTLRRKADYYERHIEEWGHKRLGFIHTLYQKDGEWIREISDNDGGHTAPYLAAMCYKYVVTGDETARQEAVESFKAMLWLDRITPVDGFIARAIWSTTADQDLRSRHGSGGLPAKWYPTKDGKWYWKGDTSSDEITAHYYSVSLFYDLVAEGREKELAREHLTRIAAHIIDNGWVLRDMDGKPTRWGRWDPKYLLSPYGSQDAGLNALEIQAFIRTALVVSGDQKFKDGFEQLLNFGYHDLTVRQKFTFPPMEIAPWDDNLAYRSYYTLLRYTDDPDLRSIYLRSIARTWEIKRVEHIPWFNFAYGAISGNDCDAEPAVKHLREWTLDCVEHSFRNSHRDDLFTECGYRAYEGRERAISPREQSVSRGSRSAIVYDGGAGGRRVMEPTSFLRDYWMGRYHGFITAPTVTDPELISVPQRKGRTFGAKPYGGPKRPVIK
ncbi:hypothetical protein JXJ21_26695 [candidate division KSB1 bacterium]|nr:hypothetical protein [candidate division KSB1 bacterium]